MMGQTLTVHVKRTLVIEKLKENRTKYAAVYDDARKAYLEKVKEWLANTLKTVEKGEDFDLYCRFEKPEHHLEDYDDAIALLEDATDDVIEITTDQHAAFMRNKWDWMNRAKMSLGVYSQTASSL